MKGRCRGLASDMIHGQASSRLESKAAAVATERVGRSSMTTERVGSMRHELTPPPASSDYAAVTSRTGAIGGCASALAAVPDVRRARHARRVAGASTRAAHERRAWPVTSASTELVRMLARESPVPVVPCAETASATTPPRSRPTRIRRRSSSSCRAAPAKAAWSTAARRPVRPTRAASVSRSANAGLTSAPSATKGMSRSVCSCRVASAPGGAADGLGALAALSLAGRRRLGGARPVQSPATPIERRC